MNFYFNQDLTSNQLQLRNKPKTNGARNQKERKKERKRRKEKEKNDKNNRGRRCGAV